ncbi:MAG TPA: right-handed parallel beta-helix repeat-containing protein [Kofleriaceae bacterium]|nr:right-handed parallel beta-helix repeat-containing protein [Kofleriaceae bacterium]
MLRASVLLLPIAAVAACGFNSPRPSGGPDGPDTDGSVDSRCDLEATWEQGKQPTKTVYISKTPGPGTPDGTQQNPFQTLDAARSMIGPGTQLLLGPGDYGGVTFTDKRGTADAPIWLEGPSSGQRARILGGTGAGLHLIGAQYWVIRNLEISDLTQSAAINVDDGSGPDSAHHIVVDRVTIGNSSRPCLQFSGVTDVTIRDSTLGSCDRGVMMVGVQRAVIGRTTIGSMASIGVAFAGGSADIEVRQNTIGGITGKGVWIGGDSDVAQFRPPLSATTGNTEARNIRVFNNVIENVQDAITCSNCGSSLVAHNLFRGVSNTVLTLHQPYPDLDDSGTTYVFAPAGGVKLVNNAIEATSGAAAFFDNGSGTAPSTCTFSHNMWLRNNGAWTPQLPTTEEMGQNGKDSGYLGNGQLCASASSLAARAGTPLPEVPGTLQGQCRPTPPSPPSIGPSEPDPGC